MISVVAEHIELIAQALATNRVLQTLRLEAPNKYGGESSFATLPVQQLNGSLNVELIDLSTAVTSASLYHPTGAF